MSNERGVRYNWRNSGRNGKGEDWDRFVLRPKLKVKKMKRDGRPYKLLFLFHTILNHNICGKKLFCTFALNNINKNTNNRDNDYNNNNNNNNNNNTNNNHNNNNYSNNNDNNNYNNNNNNSNNNCNNNDNNNNNSILLIIILIK